jgi:hypothetical protein
MRAQLLSTPLPLASGEIALSIPFLRNRARAHARARFPFSRTGVPLAPGIPLVREKELTPKLSQSHPVDHQPSNRRRRS